MISNIKYSILLPGAFFDNRWPHKIDMIIEKFNCNTIYFFDHTINPINTDYPIYKQFEAIQEVLDYRKDIRLGTLVTNLSRSSGDDICFSLSSIMSATNCFDFGIGVGDGKYEKNTTTNNFNIDQSIELILNSFDFDNKSFSIFIGGTSEYVNSIAVRYDLGLNIWNKDQEYITKKFQEIGIKNKGRNSFTMPQDSLGVKVNIPSYCDEIIFVIKDSSFDQFIMQLDNIKGWIET